MKLDEPSPPDNSCWLYVLAVVVLVLALSGVLIGGLVASVVCLEEVQQ